MAAGRKTGGRQKGTPNKKTREIQSLLDSLGCDPVEGMVKIAMDENNPPELRGRMFSELSQYVYPKRKSIEVAAEVTTNFVVDSNPLSVDEWQTKHKPSGDPSQVPSTH